MYILTKYEIDLDSVQLAAYLKTRASEAAPLGDVMRDIDSDAFDVVDEVSVETDDMQAAVRAAWGALPVGSAITEVGKGRVRAFVCAIDTIILAQTILILFDESGASWISTINR